MTSNQTSDLSFASNISKPMIITSESETVLPSVFCTSRQNSENESNVKKQKNDTESEINRLRKIVEAKHPRRLLLKTQEEKSKEQELGTYEHEIGSSRQNVLQIQDETSKEREIILDDKLKLELNETLKEQKETIRIRKMESNDQDETVTKEDIPKSGETSEIQMNVSEAWKGSLKQDEMLEDHKINPKQSEEDSTCHEKMLKNPEEKHDAICITDNSEFSDTSNLKEQTYDTSRTYKEDVNNILYHDPKQVLSEEANITNKWQAVTEALNVLKTSPQEKGKLAHQDTFKTSYNVNTNYMDFSSQMILQDKTQVIGKQVGWSNLRAGKVYSNKSVPGGSGSAISDIYQQQISTELSDSDTDECEFINDLFGRRNSDNLTRGSNCNIKGKDLVVSSNKTEEPNTSDNSLLKEITPGCPLELSRSKRNEIVGDMEIKMCHSQENDSEDCNKENTEGYVDNETGGNTGNIIKINDLPNDIGQLPTRVKPFSLVYENMDNNQDHIRTQQRSHDIQETTLTHSYALNNIEPMYRRGTNFEIQFSEDEIEEGLSYSLYNPHHKPGSNQLSLLGHNGNLSQSETSHQSDVGNTNNSSSLLSLQQRNESSYNDQHLIVDQLTCTAQDQANGPLEDYADNDLQITTGEIVPSLITLAEQLGFIVKDVTPDGNCMFSAIVDQLRISGNLDFTPQTLRMAAVSLLRKNPINKDGTHMESFLHMESWETYLTRMAQEYVWGDHLALQACAEVTGYRIHVIKYPLVVTKLEPASSEAEEYSILYLGHVSESHFISLRQKDWEETWHIKAKVRKLQKCFPKIFESCMNKKLSMRQNHINLLVTEIKLLKSTMRKREYGLDAEEQRQRTDGIKSQDTDIVDVIEVASLSPEDTGKEEIELPTDDECEELENWLTCNKDPDLGLVREKFAIDDKAGASLLHLSYLVKLYVKQEYMIKVYVPNDRCDVLKPEEVKTIGSVPEDLRYSFRHRQEVSKRDCNCGEVNLQLKRLYVNRESRVLLKETEAMKTSDLMSEAELCNPGYTLLCPSDVNLWKRDLYYINQQKPAMRCRDFVFDRKTSAAFACVSWPESTLGWSLRDRPSGWPNKEHIQIIKDSECLVVPQPHPKSALPECEWQFIFPDAELILAKDCLSEMQKYCFIVFKVLVDFHLQNGLVRLSTTHLKTVMYFACEVIPQSCWSKNVGGCILYLLECLGKCLSEKNLPNYFINDNNMIDHFSEEQISWAIEKLLTLRLFPMLTIVHFADHHGFDIQKVNSILADIETFQKDRNADRAIHDVFVPTSVNLAIAVAKTNYRSLSSFLFQDAYDEMLDAPNVSGYVQLENEIPTFERFLQEILNKQTDKYLRNLLAYTFDTYCGTHFGYRNDIKTLGSIMGEEAGPYSDEPITSNVDDTLSQVQYIDNRAYSFYMKQKYEDCARFLRCAIAKAKREFHDINMNDVQTSAGPTKQISVRRNEVLERLYMCLIHLYQCYVSMGRAILYQEYIVDLEDVAYKSHYKSRSSRLHEVATIWNVLGHSRRAKTIWNQIPKAFTP